MRMPSTILYLESFDHTALSIYVYFFTLGLGISLFELLGFSLCMLLKI